MIKADSVRLRGRLAPNGSLALQLPRTRGLALVSAQNPSVFEWLVVIFGLIVQQGAFISMPLVVSGDSLRVTVNPLNTIAVAISMASLALVLLPQIRKLASLARRNVASMLFMVLVLLSATWSIYPDLTIRRGAGYVLTIALASYLVVRFDAGDRMRCLSMSFVFSAVGSLLCVAFFPHFGIMEAGELAGAWRGVFPHKNVFGPAMAVAVFTELYLLIKGEGRSRWRFALLAGFAVLVGLSQSATAWILALLYVGGACLYMLWRRQRLAASVAVLSCSLVVLAAVIALWSDPGMALNAVGKDASITGRTTLWEVVLAFIREKPLLGWGYHAMWVLGDPNTIYADKITGNWGITSAHNAFLEITVQLGLVGFAVILMILVSALASGVRCCRAGIAPLGWFSVVFFVGAILAAQTVETLGRSQSIEWIVFNVLLFGCSMELAASTHPGRFAATKDVFRRSVARRR